MSDRDRVLSETVAALKEYGSGRKAAKALGIPRSTFMGRLKAAAKAGKLGFKPVLPGFEIKQTSAQLGAAGEVQREWVQQRPESGPAFDVPEGHSIRGVSALVDPDGGIRQQWIKTWRDETAASVIEAAKSAFARHRPLRRIAAPRRIERGLLNVYPIADQHLGLLSWGRETGEAYDLRIGVARLRACMARLVGQSPPAARALILNLGDWQHADDQRNMTPRSGNVLDVDGRYFKVLVAGVDLMVDCIALALRKHAEVIVANLPGNHDPHSSRALTIALAAHFRNNPRVEIVVDPSEFFFYRFGATLIGANHGHKMRPDRMAMTMAVLRREDWGKTRFHVFYFGHIHHETLKEVGDVRVESFRTIAAKDAHAASSGYVSGQSLTSITHHVRDGEIARSRVNVILPPPRA
jgi:hypothetical protein